MTFEQLDAFKQELIADAYLADVTWRLRLKVASVVCVVVMAALWWAFARGDDSGTGFGVACVFSLPPLFVTVWMAFQAISLSRVKWVIRSFELEPAAEKELRASLQHARELINRRLQARKVIGEEFKEAVKRAAEGNSHNLFG